MGPKKIYCTQCTVITRTAVNSETVKSGTFKLRLNTKFDKNSGFKTVFVGIFGFVCEHDLQNMGFPCHTDIIVYVQ